MPKLRRRKKQRRKILFIGVEAVTLPAKWKPIHAGDVWLRATITWRSQKGPRVKPYHGSRAREVRG